MPEDVFYEVSSSEGSEVVFDVGYSQKIDPERDALNAKMSRLDVVSAVVKTRCDACGFVVNPVGHAERCRVPVPSRQLELQRLRAWFGDAWHICHIRWLLVHAKVPTKDLQIVSQRYVGAAGQVKWYQDYVGVKLVALGTSEHSVSTAFEASYYLLSQFRVDYLKHIVSVLDCDVSSDQFDYLLSMFDCCNQCPELVQTVHDNFVLNSS